MLLELTRIEESAPEGVRPWLVQADEIAEVSGPVCGAPGAIVRLRGWSKGCDVLEGYEAIVAALRAGSGTVVHPHGAPAIVRDGQNEDDEMPVSDDGIAVIPIPGTD